MKKLLISILSFLAIFLIGAKITADANSEWTLEADGYYYYNNDILFNDEVHYLASNGNPIFIKNNDSEIVDDWRIHDYTTALKGRIIARNQEQYFQ